MLRRRTLAGVLGLQAVAVVAVMAWGTVLGHPWAPDGGLQQLDLLYLDEPAPLDAVAGQPTLVATTGSDADSACAEQVREALRRRGSDRGLPTGVGLVVLTPEPGALLPAASGARVVPDPAGATADLLVLDDPSSGCTPGYALLDGDGRLRYRTVDPSWAEHSDEQRILLDALETS